MNLSPLFPIAAVAFAMQTPNGLGTAEVARQVDAMYPKLEAIYKDLHAHPELAFQETRTAAKLAAEMRAIGFEVTEKIGKTGVVAIYRNEAGPTVLVRTGIDGQPAGGGQDVHMASWLGAARTLVALKSQWKGTLMFIAQPADEASGARAMQADGLFSRFAKPDYAFALHSRPLPYGAIGYNSGAASGSNDPLVERTAVVLKQAFGDANVARMPATGAGEDSFAFEGVPSMFFFTGTSDQEAVAQAEPSIKTAAEAMSLAVLDVMAHQ